MATRAEDGVAEIWADWQDAVNMTANQLEDFLDTEESKSVGDKGSGCESTGHQSGRRIVTILRRNKGELTEDDAAHMRKRWATCTGIWRSGPREMSAIRDGGTR